MKSVLIPILLLLSIAQITIGQNLLNEKEIKSSVKQIFDLSEKQDFTNLAAKLFNSKSMKQFDVKNKSDARSVKRSGKKIKAYLDLSDSYEYENLEFENFKNLPGANLNVVFRSGSQNLTISFVFVEFKNKVLLAKFN